LNIVGESFSEPACINKQTKILREPVRIAVYLKCRSQMKVTEFREKELGNTICIKYKTLEYCNTFQQLTCSVPYLQYGFITLTIITINYFP
jgi:hypothetical protein